LIEQQIGQLDQEMASLLRPPEDAVKRLAEVPGLGVAADSQSSCQRRSEDKRKHFRDRISPPGHAHGA